MEIIKTDKESKIKAEEYYRTLFAYDSINEDEPNILRGRANTFDKQGDRRSWLVEK